MTACGYSSPKLRLSRPGLLCTLPGPCPAQVPSLHLPSGPGSRLSQPTTPPASPCPLAFTDCAAARRKVISENNSQPQLRGSSYPTVGAAGRHPGWWQLGRPWGGSGALRLTQWLFPSKSAQEPFCFSQS